jgi:hypothetical protein
MSSDEEMAIIGRMVTERSSLAKRDIVLREEIGRVGKGLEELSRRLVHTYQIAEFELSGDERSMLDAARLSELLTELGSVSQRISELDKKLEKM